jgi:hypothetical protein
MSEEQLERLIEQGEMVTTGYVSGRGAKSAFCSIANLKDLEVELDINESDIPRVRLGQECVVSPDSYPDRKYKARVREIAPEANRQKATIQVKVAIETPDEYLRPETNAKVNFLEEEGICGGSGDTHTEGRNREWRIRACRLPLQGWTGSAPDHRNGQGALGAGGNPVGPDGWRAAHRSRPGRTERRG